MNPRTTIPEDGNKYYIRKKDGGYSTCIDGSPKHAKLTALANCVGYAVGRFNEIGGYGCCKYLGSTNAENMAELAKTQGLTVQKQPVLGGCMVWAKGKAGNAADGAGHVAIVEQINPDGSILTSESGYNYKAFYMTKRSAPNWETNTAYTYIGCIVNPAVHHRQCIRLGDKGAEVELLQARLHALGYMRKSEIDGDFGKITLGAVLAFQLQHGMEVDGVAGPKTQAALAG